MRTDRLDRPGRPRRPAAAVRGVLVSAALCAAIAVTSALAFPARVSGAEAGAAESVEVTPALIREVQFMLLHIGMDPGPIDGIVGSQTVKAFRKFEERSGFPPGDLANGGRISASLLARLRGEASRAMFEGEKKPAPAPAVATPPAVAIAPPPAAPPSDRFAACAFNPEDFRIGGTQYTPDNYLQAGFDGSTARAVAMLKERLNEARQIAGNIGGAALTEVQRQSHVLDYFSCRLKVEQASEK